MKDNLHKAISIKQPYANWIINGTKRYEIRSWSTKYRGRLIICSCQKPVHREAPGPNGCIVGEVKLVNIIPFKPSMVDGARLLDWIPDQYAWVLDNPTLATNNVPVKGRLSLYELPKEILEEAFNER